MMEDAVHFLSKDTVVQAISRSATKVSLVLCHSLRVHLGELKVCMPSARALLIKLWCLDVMLSNTLLYFRS